MLYRAKEQPLQAKQWDGSVDGAVGIASDMRIDVAIIVAADGDVGLKIVGPNGDLWVAASDWVVKPPNASPFAIKDRPFQEKFQSLEKSETRA